MIKIKENNVCVCNFVYLYCLFIQNYFQNIIFCIVLSVNYLIKMRKMFEIIILYNVGLFFFYLNIKSNKMEYNIVRLQNFVYKI